MRITLIETLATLRPLFTGDMRPRERFARAQAPLYGPGGLVARLGLAQRVRDQPLFAVMEAAQIDGYDAVFGKQVWGLFNPARDLAATRWLFDRYAELDVTGQAVAALHACAEAVPDAAPPEIALALAPADPADFQLLLTGHGLSGIGGAGWCLLRLWPSAGNLARLGPALARHFAHAVRAGELAVSAPTLGDLVALEGLAACFVAERYPDLPGEPWMVPFARPADDAAALAYIAGFYGVGRYEDVPTNVYGAREDPESCRVPDPAPLAADDLDYARAVIADARDERDPGVQAAYLYGDAIIARVGHPSVGLPPYAGFAVGYHAARARLAQRGLRAGAALALPTAEWLTW